MTFKIEELEICFCQNTFIAKFGLLWGRILIMGKGGVFWHLINFTLDEFDLQKQTKRWQRAIQICQIIVKNNLVLNYIDVAPLLVAFGCVGINHQKGGD